VGGSGFEDKEPGRPETRTWVVSLDFPGSRDIVRPKIDYYMPTDSLREWRQADQMYVLKDGTQIGLKSADSGREKFQGVSRTLIWMDEECPEPIFDECLARTIDCGGKIVLTMTPLNGMSYTYDRVFKAAENDPDIFVMHSTMWENPYIPKKEIDRARAQITDKSVQDVRFQGLYTLLAGSHVFDRDKISEYRRLTRGPIHVDRGAGVSIWEWPNDDVEYVIGADTGKGKEKGDYSAAVVLDTHNRSVVATLRCRVDAEAFAERLADLGTLYNRALVNPERNDHGIITVKGLQRLGYHRIWRKRPIGRVVSNLTDDLGFETNVVGKPLLVSTLQRAIQEMALEIPCPEVVDELSTYIWYDDKLPELRERHKIVGRCGAMRGRHDDLVIALGLAIVALDGLGRIRVKEPLVEIPDYQRRLLAKGKRKVSRGPVMAVDRKYFVMGAR